MTSRSRFLVDEDLPRLLTHELTRAGFQADDVRDVGLRGSTDDEVLEHATREGATVLTGDRGFGSTLRFPLGTHGGIVVVRYPDEMPLGDMAASVIAQLHDLDPEELHGNVVVLEPGRVRVRSRPNGDER